ncbi:MAG: cytidylate kinase family protein [Nitrospinae bacterium]|nr:cytidylate kinase family protein [Nitrospinota bacterium]
MNEAADKGNVVIGGWGGQVLLKDRTDVLHLRIVGSLEARIRHFMESSGVTRTAAEETIKRSDRDQGLFSQYFFNVDFADSTLYHGTLNIEQTAPESMISFIESMIAEKEKAAS